MRTNRTNEALQLPKALQLPQSGPQPSRRILSADGVTCIYEDRNNDGKLDLYSYTYEEPYVYGNARCVNTYYDNDGDGYFDERIQAQIDSLKEQKQGVTCYIQPSTLKEAEMYGKKLGKTGNTRFTKVSDMLILGRTYFEKTEKPSLQSILNSKLPDNSWWF